MGLFDDPNKLLNRNFGWGLASYSDITLDGEEIEDVEKLALFVDEDGVLNAAGRIMLWNEKDPVDSAFLPTFTKDNLFIEGLKKVINPFPTFGVLVFPTTQPGSRDVVSEGGWFGTIYSAGSSVRFPQDTPEGFVPCAGQLLRYPKGSGIGDVVVPNMISTTRDVGDGGVSTTTYYAPPGGAWMMKVPEGYVEMVPDLRGRELRDFGTPGGGLFFG